MLAIFSRQSWPQTAIGCSFPPCGIIRMMLLTEEEQRATGCID
jgi:hypothetical protein